MAAALVNAPIAPTATAKSKLLPRMPSDFRQEAIAARALFRFGTPHFVEDRATARMCAYQQPGRIDRDQVQLVRWTEACSLQYAERRWLAVKLLISFDME